MKQAGTTSIFPLPVSAAMFGFVQPTRNPTMLKRCLGGHVEKAAREREMKMRIKLGTRLASTLCLATLMVPACFVPAWTSAKAQQSKAASTAAGKSDVVIDNAGKKGIPLTTTSNVSQEASIQAVLIPSSLAQRIFGKEVSQNYAVVEVIVSNRDSNASLVLHSVFLDYSNWVLSGTSMANRVPLTGLDPTQAATKSSQVASIESRLVRGELLDAQQWTKRNWTMRSLAALGTVAVGFEFPFSTDVIKGIGAFNGVVVPGASTLWPDGTVNQINRISDFGFQTNKIIPKQGSDILVAFFPIDRFLTSTFRKEFLSNPAGWFVPFELLVDPKTEPGFEKIVKPLADGLLANSNATASDTNSFKAQMLQAMLAGDCSSGTTSVATPATDNKPSAADGAASPAHENDPACKLQRLINGVSLNNIHVVIEGVMTVDVATVPATIYSVDFQNANLPSIWTTTGTDQAGSITGVYLTGGVPAIVDESGKAIVSVTVTANADNSTDTELDFTMKLSKCIASGTKVYFVVNKSQDAASTSASTSTAKPASSVKKAANTVASTPFELPVQPSMSCPAADDSKGAAATPAAPAAGEKPASLPAASPDAAPINKEQKAGQSAKG
jgi:hypothetical protein